VAIEALIQDFQDNMTNVSAGEQELFIHNYIPKYGVLEAAESFATIGTVSLSDGTDVELRDGLYFNILRYSTESITNSTVMVYESIEEQEPIIDSYQFVEISDGDGSGIGFHLSENETEIISYRNPVEFQIAIDEEDTTAQRNYVNSIQARQLEFDVLSSLGSITSEDAITDSTTTGTTTPLTTTTEAITDVGGATATGTRTNILSDGTVTRDVTIGSY
jgi:hypothetical protein